MNGALDGTTTPRVLHIYFPRLVEVLDWLSSAIELLAILVMLIGAARFAIAFLPGEFVRDGSRVERMNLARIDLGRYILTGLEVFIVSDIIHTALSLKLGDLLFLGVLVVIRSVISFFLEREIAALSTEVAGR